MRLHIICERDVGLFSLIQQVIANIPWAMREYRIPVVYFREKTCYWTPNGYQGKDTVWEYYFEPVVTAYPTSSIPERIRKIISVNHPSPFEVGYYADECTFVTNNFGDHPNLRGKALFIPYLWDDPDDAVRQQAKAIIEIFIRPRAYILQKVNDFFEKHMSGHYVIGVHARGTDASSEQEIRPHRQGALVLSRYITEIRRLLDIQPNAKIFVAADDESSLNYLKEVFGTRVIAYDSIRHQGGEAAGQGPTGWIMPAYIAGDRDLAARNGEEAVVEYLLLSRCDYLVHNGSSLARTVLLNVPQLPHKNTHHRELVSKAEPVFYPTAQPSLRPEELRVTDIDPEVIKRVKAYKARQQSSSIQYRDRPRLAFIVQSFNRVSNIDQLLAGLRRMGDHELIVCDDGSLDGSREKWMSYLDQPNDFLIHSNDLHEIRILDRAIRFAYAEIVCLVQDDDLIPHETGWLDSALTQFDTYPNLAIIGGFMGFDSIEAGAWKLIFGEAPFRFVYHVNIGPYFIRKRHYEALGGWDYSFSRAGEPGICFESELCLRAWINGYQVGYSFVPFKGPSPWHYPLNGGTMLFSDEVRFRNMLQNQNKIFEMYGKHVQLIDRLVREANRRIGLL